MHACLCGSFLNLWVEDLGMSGLLSRGEQLASMPQTTVPRSAQCS